MRSDDQARFAVEEIPPEGLDFRAAVAAYQSHLISGALERSGGVQRRAAKMLKLSPTTLNEMVHRLGLQETDDNDSTDSD